MGFIDFLLKRFRPQDAVSELDALEQRSSIQQDTQIKTDLDKVNDRYTSRVRTVGTCIQLYTYVKVPIVNVDRDALLKVYEAASFAAEPTLLADGSVVLYSKTENIVVGQLVTRADMCRDWLKRGDPIRCEFTGFHTGQEHVLLSFYRDEQLRLKDRASVIVKLSACFSQDKQESIEMLEAGEKLNCCEDDDNDEKVNVLDYSEEAIGRLPKKYADIFMEEGFAGIFFDHTEENDSGKLIPYVKIYLR